MMKDNNIITIAEAERQLGMTKGRIRQDVHRKKFNSDEVYKIGRDWVITEEALKRYDRD